MVKHGDQLAQVDLDKIKQAKKATDMMVIVTNMPAVAYMKFTFNDQNRDDNVAVLKVTTK